MTGYTPIFSKIVDSSLWCEPDNVVKIFLTMLAKKDRDNVCRGSAFNISQWAKKTEQEVLEALQILASPDTRRLEPQPFDGRRIEKVEDGWLILNGATYQAMMVKINRRAYKTAHEAERRERMKEGVNPDEHVPESGEKIVKKRPTLEKCIEMAIAAGMQKKDGEEFFDYYESNGWKVGKNSMKSPESAIRNWKRRSKDYSSNGSGQSVFALREIIKAKEAQCADLKLKHCSEAALGDVWTDKKSKESFYAIRKEIKELNGRIAGAAQP